MKLPAAATACTLVIVASFVATVATIIELADTRALVTTFDASAAAKLDFRI